MLGAFFMATDYVTSPMSAWGKIIFGIGIGFIVMVIRTWGNYPEGMSFAILIMNACVPLLNKIRPQHFGEPQELWQAFTLSPKPPSLNKRLRNSRPLSSLCFRRAALSQNPSRQRG